MRAFAYARVCIWCVCMSVCVLDKSSVQSDISDHSSQVEPPPTPDRLPSSQPPTTADKLGCDYIREQQIRCVPPPPAPSKRKEAYICTRTSNQSGHIRTRTKRALTTHTHTRTNTHTTFTSTSAHESPCARPKINRIRRVFLYMCVRACGVVHVC